MEDSVKAIILMEIPTVLILSILLMYTYRVFSEKSFRFFAYGFSIHFIHLCYRTFEFSLQSNFGMDLINNALDLLPSHYILVGLRYSKYEFYKSNYLKKISNASILTIYTFAIISISFLNQSVKLTDLYISYSLSATLNFIPLVFFALYVKSLLIKNSIKDILGYFNLTLFYAIIQIIHIFSNQYIYFNNMAVNLYALIFKLVLVLLVVNYIFKQGEKYANKNEIAQKLDLIIGRTFHELISPMSGIDRRMRKLISKEDRFNHDLVMNKGVEAIIHELDDAIIEFKTIISSSRDMYMADFQELNLSDNASRLPLFIEPTFESHNVNSLILIAIMNLKAIVLDPRNHFVSDRLKIKTQWARNCDFECNSTELIQIFFNLLKNSYEASIRSGYNCEIDVRTNIVTIEDPIKNRKYIYCEIEDNGPGIIPEDRDSIFIEGVSSKDNSEKIKGYGLPIIKKLLNKYGAELEIVSPVPNKRTKGNYSGTKMIIKLPKNNDKKY